MMDAVSRIEQALATAVDRAEFPGCPPRLIESVRYAVFPKGARIRPRLCLAVAGACGDDRPEVTEAAAAALEFLHCASLIHDDLPCFDDAATRRGKPSVHRAFGEPLAVLAGDALIVLAFQTLAFGAARVPERLVGLVTAVGSAVGMPRGIVAGQAWECESEVDLSAYHQSKTGALFSAATVSGAAAAGAPGEPWRMLGERLGEAYQIADDIRDVVADPDSLGKDAGQDALLGRPSAVAQFGLDGAIHRFEELTAAAVDSIPACPGAVDLRKLIVLESNRLLPKGLVHRAA
jgi:geranylgeranyl diphosphate synthase type II